MLSNGFSKFRLSFNQGVNVSLKRFELLSRYLRQQVQQGHQEAVLNLLLSLYLTNEAGNAPMRCLVLQDRFLEKRNALI